MLIKTPSVRGVVYLDGDEIEWDGGRIELPPVKAKRLLSLPGYTIAVRSPEPYSRAKRILISRGSGMGDVLLAIRLVKEIKEKLAPNAKIDYACSGEFSSLGLGFKHARVIKYDDIPDNAADVYNKIVELNSVEFSHYSGSLHRLDVFAHFAGVPHPIKNKHLIYKVSDEEKEWAKDFIKNENISRPMVVVATSANCINRVFSHGNNWRILNGLIQHGVFPIIVDKDTNKVYGGEVKDNSIHFTGKPIRKVAALIDQADAVVTPDTGIMHLASALDKWTIAYFGAINWKLRKTHDKLIPLYSTITDCYPCNGYDCGSPKCLRDLGIERVIHACLHILSENWQLK